MRYRSPYLPGAVLTLALALALCAPAPAHAQAPPELSAKEKKQARALVKQAKAHRKAADKLAKRKGKRNQAKAKARYKKSAIAYLGAYRLLQMPVLLVPLGQVYQARGERAWALRTFKKYVELKPDGSLLDDAQSAIAELETELAEARLAGDVPEAGDPDIDPTDIIGPEPEPDKPDEQTDTSDGTAGDEGEDGGTGDGDGQEDGDIVKKTPAKKNGRLLSWSGIGAAALGAALIGTGVGFGVSAQSAAETLSSNDDGWTEDDRMLIETGQSRQTNMYIFTSLGAAFIVGGATLFYLGMRANKNAAKGESAEASAILAPSITPTSATLTVMGRF